MRKFTLPALALAAALLGSPAFAQAPAADAAPASVTLAAQAGWWHALGDPALSALIAQGLDANFDIERAHARIRRSQALVAGARADFWPGGTAGLRGRAAQAGQAEAPGLTRDDRRAHSVAAAMEF